MKSQIDSPKKPRVPSITERETNEVQKLTSTKTGRIIT